MQPITRFFGSSSGSGRDNSKRMKDKVDSSSGGGGGAGTKHPEILVSRVSTDVGSAGSSSNTEDGLVTKKQIMHAGPSTASNNNNMFLLQEIEHLKRVISQLTESLHEKSSQLKAVSNNQTIIHAQLKKSLQQKEEEIQSTREEMKRKNIKIRDKLEEMILSVPAYIPIYIYSVKPEDVISKLEKKDFVSYGDLTVIQANNFLIQKALEKNPDVNIVVACDDITFELGAFDVIKEAKADLSAEFVGVFSTTRILRIQANLAVEGFTLTAGRVVNIDPLRQLRVAREHRVYRVRQETRTIKVPSETRILVI
jgi:hypothetical protein